MRTSNLFRLAALVLALVTLALVLPIQEAATRDDDDGGGFHLIAESAILAGLPAGAVFPFLDTTPNRIPSAHVAVTDSTANCSPGAAAPDNVQVLVGEAGVALVPVLTAATNTGISNTPGQCVFHITVEAGVGGIPARVTDIVVVNGGNAALTGVNTVTASAEVVRERRRGKKHNH